MKNKNHVATVKVVHARPLVSHNTMVNGVVTVAYGVVLITKEQIDVITVPDIHR